jgi:hypothetical protein
MRRVLTLLSIAAVALMASAVQAQAQTYTWTANLSGSNEAPPVAATGSGGRATVTYDAATQTGTYSIDVYNLPTGVTASHIHAGGPGVSGPVIINFTVANGTSNDFRISGTFKASDVVARPAQGVNNMDDALAAMLLGEAYVNVHSQANGGGEIRGQLVLKQ